MKSSGMRVVSWNYLRWWHVSSIIKDDKLLAARNNVYAGEDYVHFILRTQDVFSLESVDIEVSVEGISPKMFGL